MTSAAQQAIERVAVDNKEDEVEALRDAYGKRLVPYLQTSHSRVQMALRAMKLKAEDFFVDVGCGDGRVALAAAADVGATSVGIDVSPALIRCCHRAANSAGFSCAPDSRLRFLLADFGSILIKGSGKADIEDEDAVEAVRALSRATAIYVYLLPMVTGADGMAPYLLRAISRGVRVLSLESHLPEPNDAEAVAKLPADCQRLVHLLRPAETWLCGKMRLYENRTARAPSPSELDTIWPLQPTALPLGWLQPPVPVPPSSLPSPASSSPTWQRFHHHHHHNNAPPSDELPSPASQPMHRCDSAAHEARRAAILAHALPRRTQLPNRLDPFDCTHVAVALRQALVEAGRWCSMRAFGRVGGMDGREAAEQGVSCGSEPVARQLTVGRHSITIFEQQGDYATRVWLSSIELSAWLTRHAASFAGKRALELGAGTGICSLALAMDGRKGTGEDAQEGPTPPPTTVIATDISDEGLRLLARAARANGLRNLECQAFDICGDTPLPSSVELLIASDALYTPQLARALARRCLEITRRGGRAIVADPGRPARRLFQAVLEQEGGLRRTDFLPIASAVPDARTLVLLHVAGERSVSSFAAHAELEG